MVKLIDADILTREVLAWKGLHLFHAPGSSCSQKVRIYLNLKGLDWTSHPIDVLGKENLRPYYMGINPRGLVPTLVDDGAVHIESNDILVHLERKFPEYVLIPPVQAASIGRLLQHEDDLHMALRTLTFRFMRTPSEPPKSRKDLLAYAGSGSGMIEGHADQAKVREAAFWAQFLDGGISDAAAREATEAFRIAFTDLDQILRRQPFVTGVKLSVIDIAWIVYANRIMLCGYPLEPLHPALWSWFRRLSGEPAFAKELSLPDEAAESFRLHQKALTRAGLSLEQVTGL